jgi:hypothetical protein
MPAREVTLSCKGLFRSETTPGIHAVEARK